MAVDFPNSPSVNDTFTSNGKTFVWTGTRWDLQSYTASKGSFYTGDSAPGSPLTGDIWYDTSVGKTYMRYDSYWVEVGNSGAVQSTHAALHRNGGTDQLDGDRLHVDYVPTTYTRNAAASGATASTDLTAHLDGINTHFLRYQISGSAPSSPVTGALWLDTTTGQLKTFYGSTWVSTGYPSGSVIQTVWKRSDVRTTYASNNSGNGTTITELNLTITPRFSNSTIFCQWMINGELHQDNVFLIHKDGAVQTNPAGYNNTVGGRHVGYASGFYDQNEDSTPSNWKLMYLDNVLGSTASRTYAPAVRSSSGSNYTLSLNRTLNAASQDAYESMVSVGVAMEIAA